jgi:hypothetical protein
VAIGVFARRIATGLTALSARAGAWWAIITSPNRADLIRRRNQSPTSGAASADGSDGDQTRRETPSARAARLEAERMAAVGDFGPSPAFGVIGPDGPPALIFADCGAAGAGTGARGIGGRQVARPNRKHPDLAVSKGAFLWADRRGFRRRLAIALPAGLAGPFLFFGFGFIDLYLQNPSEFPFGFNQVAGPSLILAGALGLIACLILMSLRGRVFDTAVSLALGVALAAWVQANFLNVDYGELNGVAIRWEDYARLAFVNTAIWLVLALAVVALRLISRRVWNLAAWLLPVGLIAAGTIGLITTYSATDTRPWTAKPAEYPTFEGAFTASSTANQYIFVLDMMDQKFVEEIQAEDPSFFAGRLDGFTQFDNHISNYSRTSPSAVDMLTGERYQFDEPWGLYTGRAYRDGVFLPELRRAGYSTNIYATDRYSYSDINDIKDLADNIRPAVIDTSTETILKGFADLAGFRYAPHVLKPTFWTPTDPFAESKPDLSASDAFSNANIGFYTRLKASGLELDGPQPRFSYIHLDGAHTPVRMNADVEAVPVNSLPLAEQAKGAFKIVFDYLDELRRLGRYKDATIVITADHGHWLDSDHETLPQPRLTALFVKPAGAEGTPLAHCDAPTEMVNVRATLLADAGADNPEGAPTVFEVPVDSTAPRDFFYRRGQNLDEGLIEHWQVTGDARDFANWRLLGVTETKYWN